MAGVECGGGGGPRRGNREETLHLINNLGPCGISRMTGNHTLWAISVWGSQASECYHLLTMPL